MKRSGRDREGDGQRAEKRALVLRPRGTLWGLGRPAASFCQSPPHRGGSGAWPKGRGPPPGRRRPRPLTPREAKPPQEPPLTPLSPPSHPPPLVTDPWRDPPRFPKGAQGNPPLRALRGPRETWERSEGGSLGAEAEDRRGPGTSRGHSLGCHGRERGARPWEDEAGVGCPRRGTHRR